MYWRFYSGANGDLLQEDSRCMPRLPGLLQPELLPLSQVTAAPCLCRRHSKAGLTQSLVGITAAFPQSWCAQGFVCVLQASLAVLRFDSKSDFAPLPSCGASPLLLDAGNLFFGVIQRSPVDGCSAASCDLGVLAGEDECTSFYSAILSMDPESKTLEKMKGINLYDFGLGNSFLIQHQKYKQQKKKK